MKPGQTAGEDGLWENIKAGNGPKTEAFSEKEPKNDK